MGTWRLVEDHGSKYLILEDPDESDGMRDFPVSENEVAKLLLFLQSCHESWRLTPRPPDSSPIPALPGPGP